MSDKRPKKDFNASGKTPEEDPNPDQAEDNVEPTPKPSFRSEAPHPGKAPTGAMGIRSQPEGRDTKDAEIDVEFEPEEPLRFDESSTVPFRFEQKELQGYTAEVEIDYDQSGLAGGPIQKLDLKKDGFTVSRFNDGVWEDKSRDPRAEKALDQIRTALEGSDYPREITHKEIDRDL